MIERALALDPVAGLEVFDILPGPGDVASANPEHPASDDLNRRSALTRLERELLAEVLKRSHGVSKEAARLFGIDPRNLAYYVKKHELPPGSGDE